MRHINIILNIFITTIATKINFGFAFCTSIYDKELQWDSGTYVGPQNISYNEWKLAICKIAKIEPNKCKNIVVIGKNNWVKLQLQFIFKKRAKLLIQIR